MSSIAEAFGDGERARFAADNLVIGAVILTYVADTNPPKEKRLIIVGESYDHLSVAAIYINTGLNINVFQLKNCNRLIQSLQQRGGAT